MKRIFFTLAVLSTLALAAAFLLGWTIEDVTSHDPAIQRWVSYHFLVSLAALVFAALVHALVLTYFMGTGRWMEETTHAYSLPATWQQENRTLKYRTMPAMVFCLVLLVVTGALGAAVDPASPVQFEGWGTFSAAKVHFLAAAVTIGLNLVVHLWEFQAIDRNSQLIAEILEEVRRIRTERGLPV